MDTENHRPKRQGRRWRDQLRGVHRNEHTRKGKHRNEMEYLNYGRLNLFVCRYSEFKHPFFFYS